MVTSVAKLDRNEVEDVLALTPMQEGMLLHYLKDKETDLYFEQLCLHLHASFVPSRIEAAWNNVIARNEMLRTLFRWEEVKNPVQIVLKQHSIKIAYYDFSIEEDKEEAVGNIKEEDRKNKFNLLEVPFRVTACKIGEKEWLFIISNHHILYDGWSNGIILKEFFQEYIALEEGVKQATPAKNKFKEFIRWQQKQDKKQEEEFWKGYLNEYQHTRIPTFSGFTESKLSDKISDYTFTLPDGLAEQLNAFTKSYRLTLASLFYTAWGILLSRYCNSRDILFGTTISGRASDIAGVEEMVGLFINTLPLRFKSDSKVKVLDVLQEVQQALQKRDEVQASSLADIKKYIGSKNELFDSLVVIENYPLPEALSAIEGVKIASYAMSEQTNFPLNLTISTFATVAVTLSYNESMFNASMIKRMGAHFENILQEIVKKPDNCLSELEMLPEQEKKMLLEDFNATDTVFPMQKTLGALFEAQVERTPNELAVVFKNQQLTYKELNEKANQLAVTLRVKGSAPEVVVGLLLERSVEMIISIMAVLKSGAAYLPIDPHAPQARISYLLKDSDAKILLTQSSLVSNVHEFEGAILPVDDPVSYSGEKANPENVNKPDDLAYIIYTSGTTGKPKGVMIEHRNVTNYMGWFGKTISIYQGLRYLMLMEYNFDPSIADIFGSLLHGATLYVAEKNLIYDRDSFINYVKDQQINLVDSVPAILKELLSNAEKLPSLHTILVGSEALDNNLKNQILDKGYTLFNHYGLTETTVDVSVLKCTPEPVTIGKPIANVKCFVVDAEGKLLPFGIPGELYVGGAGVGRGYLKRPELNAQKFIKSNYIAGNVYKTGDLVKWLPDGQLEFIGRVDNQINVRGFRVEPEEIQEELLAMEEVQDAAVITKQDKNQQLHLIAFFVAEEPLDTGKVKAFLGKQLPSYMIPSYFIQLDKIPHTPARKKDLKALLNIADEYRENETSEAFVAPNTDLEKTIADVWKDLLKLEKVGLHDNFFDIGGNSLYIIRLNSRLKTVLERDIPVVAMFEYPTISSFANYLNKESDEEADAVQEAQLINRLDKSKGRINQRREILKNRK